MTAEYVKAIQEANTVLLTTPECIDLVQDKNNIMWGNTGAESKKARVRLRQILNDLWQSGAYNYEEFAKSLRIDSVTVQALIDEMYIEAKGL